MAVRKQRRMKTLKGRTVAVKNRSHWDKLVKATMDGKLLIVHYSAVSGTSVSWTACRVVASVAQTSAKLCMAVTRSRVEYGAEHGFQATFSRYSCGSWKVSICVCQLRHGLVLQSWSAACKRMRPFLSEVSRKPQFHHVAFAELDVNAESTSVRALQRS